MHTKDLPRFSLLEVSTNFEMINEIHLGMNEFGENSYSDDLI